MFKNFFSPKRQRVIQGVKDYYDGNVSHIPFSQVDIKEAYSWVEKSDIPNKEMLLARLQMAQVIVKSKI